MLRWKDTTIYGGSPDRKPREWQTNAGVVSLTVLRHRNYPNTWVAQSPMFGLWPRDLETDDIDEAKRVASDMLYTALRQAMDAIDALT